MQQYQKEMRKIQRILEENPRGMTVSDIARKLKTNRNSVAKYLDIMRIAGHVEMITFGPAKVFFPSYRVPITEMLNYTSDYIIIFNQDLRIMLINEAMLRFLQKERDEFIGQPLDKTSLPFINNKISLSINEALDGKGGIKSMDLFHDSQEIYFKLRIIPTKFENGENGVSLIMKNITHQRRIQHLLKEWAKPHLNKEKNKN
jgi:PAS domain-containing protein